MTSVQLRETAIVTLNGSGNGTASIGPLSARESWTPSQVAVNVSSNTKEAQCSIYVGDRVAQSNFRDATFTGSSGDTTDSVTDQILSGWKVWAVWSGGDPGATATMVITGTKEI